MRLDPPLALASPPDTAAWDELVGGADDASVFHTSSWAQVWTAEWPGAEWRALVVSAGSGYAAGLGLIVRPRPFGRVVLSMPFGTYGGPIVRRGHDDPLAARAALLAAYARLARTRDVLLADLTWYRGDRAALPEGQRTETTFTQVRPLTGDVDALFRTVRHSVRKCVRQAEEHGLIVAPVADLDGVGAFHRVAARALGRRGARAKPLSLYRRIYERLVPARLARYDLVSHEGVAIGGSLHLLHRGVATNWLTVADERFLHLRPNHLLVARVMRELCNAGFDEYDFGASPAEAKGLIAFKQTWGATPRDVLGMRRRSALHRLLRG